MKTKKGAMELSVGTIVIIVLAMSMLILGLVLIRTIFTGSKYNIDQMNEKVKDEIAELFVEDERAVVYLPNALAEIKQGKQWGIGFAIQNAVETQEFKWNVVVDDSKIQDKCGISENKAEEFISTGGDGDAGIASGQKYYDIIRFNVPEGATSDVSTCIIRYKLVVKEEDTTPYTTVPFDVDVK